MKQLAQYQDGRLELQDVPLPAIPPGGILVRTLATVISPGTEKMKVEQAKMNLLQKARARPDQVRKVLATAKTLGWRAALEKVRNRLESPTPLGYSAAGIVEKVDPHNTRFRIGDLVACGGAECAHHAEFIAVPDLLAAPVPDGVKPWQAAYTTLAAISMQGVRQADAKLGERVVIIGQGLVGQFATALLRASGVRVMASDLSEDRLRIATQMGAERTLSASGPALPDAVHQWTEGHGADAILLCIGGDSSKITRDAIAALRDRGTLVIVGIFDAQLEWKEAYMKDIQIRYSRSYGPGRYDPSYEFGGIDYPIGHVRWTENRNFESCLHLIKSGALDLGPVTTRRAPFTEALQVYQDLMQPSNADIGVVLEYSHSSKPENLSTTPASATSISPQPANPDVQTLHVLGAGNFARTMLLPHLKNQIPFGTIVNATGLSARHVREKFSFKNADTDPASAFGDPKSAVLIATRHHLHAPLILRALENHQHAFVEKPLCLTRDELTQIDAAIADSHGSVMVGFNRRFAPATAELIRSLDTIHGPKSLAFHVNAGPLAPDHWYANLEESGGRILGEACHFIDFACAVLGSQPIRVTAQTTQPAHGSNPFPDSIAAQIEFADGSTFQLIYTAEGDASFPKEHFRLFAPGFVAEGENFQTLCLHRASRTKKLTFTSKGHAEEMRAWRTFLNGNAPHPLPYAQTRTSTLTTFALLESIQQNAPVLIPTLESSPPVNPV